MMEAYTLDEFYRRTEVIDVFDSFIWTERFDDVGDFEMVVPSQRGYRSLLRKDTRLAMNNSNYVMVVETIEDKNGSDGRRMLTVKGRSLEKIFDDRAAMASVTDPVAAAKWTITDKPHKVIEKIVHDICVVGTLSPQDIIPFIVEGRFLQPDTIPKYDDPITAEIDPQSVYKAITEIAKVWGLGYRLLRNKDLSQLHFDVYSGNDRTTAQQIFPAVVFSPELDNLQETTKLTSIEAAKNVAYVYSPAGVEVVYPQNADPDVEGFERRILTVNATDIAADDPNASYLMIQRGRAELSKASEIMAFDGEINQHSQYKYGRDYNLGDLVEVRDNDSSTNKMRVSEQIFVQDGEGERSYPTLSLYQFINPGSWLSARYNKEWVDFDETEFWANQP